MFLLTEKRWIWKTIPYITIDIGQGEPVVMVHGMMLSAYSWRNNIHALLDAGLRVILIDLPGHGQTDIPPEPYPYTIEQISSDIR